MNSLATCIFCKIIKGTWWSCAASHEPYTDKPAGHSLLSTLTASVIGEIPCFKLFESEKTLAFLDINPLSRGHAVGHIYSIPVSRLLE